MKILFLTDFYPPHYIGGYELQCHDQVMELGQRGHDILVLTSRWQVGKGEVDGRVYRLLKVINPHRGSDDLDRRFLAPLRLRRRQRQIQMGIATRQNRAIARQVIADYRPDIVFIWNMNSVGIGPVLAAQGIGIPIVFNLLDYWLANLKTALAETSNPIKQWYHKLINDLGSFAKLDVRHLIVISQAVKQTYIDLGFPTEQLQVIFPGLSVKRILNKDDLSSKNAPNDRSLKLLFVGRLIPEKGLEVALQALAHTVHLIKYSHHVCLDIIGNGAEVYRLQLHELTASLHLQDQVRFVGPLARQQVLDQYAAYDVLLVPSIWVEPFGITIIEAMARGLVVIATNHGGPAEIIDDGRNGRLVPPGDPVALAHAIVELVCSPDQMQGMRVQALQTVHEQYALENVVDRVEAYLQAVVDEQ